MRYAFLFIPIFNLLTYSCSIAQNSNPPDITVSPDISEDCHNSTITYFGVKMEYPLTVIQAKDKYNLQYAPNYIFYTTIPSLPVFNKHVNYNLEIIYSRESWTMRKNIPEEELLNKVVKGYKFWLKPPINTDSLITTLEEKFNGKFISKENLTAKALKLDGARFFYEMKISDCAYVVVTDYDPKKAVALQVCFYFDVHENERKWFPR